MVVIDLVVVIMGMGPARLDEGWTDQGAMVHMLLGNQHLIGNQ